MLILEVLCGILVLVRLSACNFPSFFCWGSGGGGGVCIRSSFLSLLFFIDKIFCFYILKSRSCKLHDKNPLKSTRSHRLTKLPT